MGNQRRSTRVQTRAADVRAAAAEPASVVILAEEQRSSYAILAQHYAKTLQAGGLRAEVQPLPRTTAERRLLVEAGGRIFLQCTIGPLFEPVPGATNVALPLHEWSRYPAGWVQRLEAFDAVWACSRFVGRVLRASGLRAPLAFVPPALDLEATPAKTRWAARRPFRLLSCGEAHFRKGFHLLVAGYLRAFPAVGEATLTIRTSPGCPWTSPRADIVISTNRYSRRRQLALFARHDAYVTASLGEGVGLPVAEAALAGLPVVANRWSGHGDLLAADGCYPIPFHVVDQPFASQPSYYAAGQRCSFSSPDVIAGALRRVVAGSARERQTIAGRAKSHLLATFGTEAAVRRLERAWRELGPV
jgi:glycosyltransferase involved in cell wall biosynthesis